MFNKYQTKVVRARGLRAGMVMYHGGEVASVVREPRRVTVEMVHGRTRYFYPTDGVRIYPNL